MSNVLVIFQTDTERTEQMALAIAVGAVEAQASIRLRRLAAPGAVEVAHKGYGRLQAADLLWANAVVVGLESPTSKADELEDLLSLTRGADPKKFGGKQAWTFNSESVFKASTEAQTFVESALRVAGFTVLPSEISTSGTEDNDLESLKQAGRSIASNSI
jgi:flavorubredoxin